jgi:hypothetical protein
MTRTRTSASLAIAAAFAGASAVSGTLATPIAHAFPIPPLAPACDSYEFPAGFNVKQSNGVDVSISNSKTDTFHNDAASYLIPNYNNQTPTNGHAVGGIDGQTIDFTINWDNGPGAGLSNHYTGVVNNNGTAQGTSVNNQNATDAWASAPLTLICATPAVAPAAAPAIPNPAPQQAPAAPVAAVPSNAVQVNINKVGANVNVVVTNTAALSGQCTYVANPTNDPVLPTVNKNFNILAGGSQTLTLLAPPPLSTYHVVVSCHGTFNGQSVEFGHVEQDVSG